MARETDDTNRIKEGTKVLYDFNENYTATEIVQDKLLIIEGDIVSKFIDELNKDEGLYLGDDEKQRKIAGDIITGLIKGNIILQGPPGTGKTSLSKIIEKVFNVKIEKITAVPEWTTFDTIGGLKPDAKDGIVGKPGKVIESILACCGTIAKQEHAVCTEQAEWLLIDEINRCEIDKTFGELFTAFGNDGVKQGTYISLLYEEDEDKKRIYVPNRYRIIGAMNNIDKNAVNELSRGLSRRFSFISILPPDESFFEVEIEKIKEKAKMRVVKKIKTFGALDNEQKLASYIDEVLANMGNSDSDLKCFIQQVRYEHVGDDGYLGLQIGTAQVIDVYEIILIKSIIMGYLSEKKIEDMYNIVDEALCSKIIPQMMDYDWEKIEVFNNAIKNDFMQFPATKAEISKMIKE